MISLFFFSFFINYSKTNMSAATNTTATIEAINDDYEYIQYNEHLRIIHSKKDDMYQMNSIITACHSIKRARVWLNNESSQELLNEIGTAENCQTEKLYQNRPNLPNELKGIYIHRLLVNHVAMWASPKYSWYIMKLLDSTFERERQQLTTTINEQKPRMVPTDRKNDYRYLIWKESIMNDNENVIFHLVRRHKSNFRQVNNHFNNDNELFYFRDNLPIAMTPNKDIKKLVKREFRGNEYTINACTNLLERLRILISRYFDEFQS